MTTKLLIARHGNTFNKSDIPTRVGKRTDLPLVQSGLEQGYHLGLYLRSNNLQPQQIIASNLKRTQQTAEQVLKALKIDLPILQDTIFDEIDYGPDENKTEEEVIARIGVDAIKRWDESAIVPSQWRVNPTKLVDNWKTFAQKCLDKHKNKITLVITSNGVARFAPHITGDFDAFNSNHNIKMSTGALSILESDGSGWKIAAWNIKPSALAASQDDFHFCSLDGTSVAK